MAYFTNAKPHIPNVFLLIQDNQARRAALKEADVIPFASAKEFRALKNDMDKSLRPAAEDLLRWNKDKGDGLGRR